MPRPLRPDFPGAFHHVTARGTNRMTIYRDDFDRAMFLDCTDISYAGPSGPYYGGQSCQLRPFAADSPRSGAKSMICVPALLTDSPA